MNVWKGKLNGTTPDKVNTSFTEQRVIDRKYPLEQIIEATR